MKKEEKRKKAVALSYSQEEDAAPRVLAAAVGRVAESLVAAAREHGVPVREEASLAEALSLLAPGTEIPQELYAAVAQILAEIIIIDKKEH